MHNINFKWFICHSKNKTISSTKAKRRACYIRFLRHIYRNESCYDITLHWKYPPCHRLIYIYIYIYILIWISCHIFCPVSIQWWHCPSEDIIRHLILLRKIFFVIFAKSFLQTVFHFQTKDAICTNKS